METTLRPPLNPGTSDFAPGGGAMTLSTSHEIRRSEEHTSELQSLTNLVCRLLLEKKKKTRATNTINCQQTLPDTEANAGHARYRHDEPGRHTSAITTAARREGRTVGSAHINEDRR